MAFRQNHGIKKTVEVAGMVIQLSKVFQFMRTLKLGLPTRDKYIENYKKQFVILEKLAFQLYVITLCQSLTGHVLH